MRRVDSSSPPSPCRRRSSPRRRPSPTPASARPCRSRASCSCTASPSRPRRRARRRRRSCSPCPPGFSIDSFTPSPGWQRAGAADRLRRGRGDPEGHVDRAAARRPARTRIFRFLGQPAEERRPTPSRSSRPTRTARSSNWNGSESSEDPAPTIEAKSSLGGGGSDTLAIVALALGAIGVVARRRRALRRRREAPARMTAAADGPRRAGGAGVALALPAAASAHAYLTKTVPVGERDARHAAAERAAHVRRGGRAALRDHLGHRQGRGLPGTTGPIARSPTNPDTLVVPLKPHLPEGWYLVYWRAISVDGHPVQGAFTFAVGPNPGPAPQFVIPHIGQSATTTAARGRPLARAPDRHGLDRPARAAARDRAAGHPPGPGLEPPRPSRSPSGSPRHSGSSRSSCTSRSRPRSTRCASFFDVASARAALADDRLRPRLRRPASSASRCFVVAGWIAIWVDRPEREQRSIAELLAGVGVAAAAAAVVPHPGRRRARRPDRAARARRRARLAPRRRRARSGSAA